MKSIAPRFLDFPCPTCTAKAGEECFYGRAHPGVMTHSRRIVLARKEADGPDPYDVVFLSDRKYRVRAFTDGRVELGRGTERATFHVARDELSYDTVAGMWRHAHKAELPQVAPS